MKEYNNLLKAIKKNKKYSNIDSSPINQEISKYFKSNPKNTKHLQKLKSKNFKKIVSSIRSKLHKSYGSFQTKKKNKRNFYLKQLQQLLKNKKDTKEIHKLLLETNISTKERLNDYKNLYKKIFKITKKPKLILDLGSGINPVSYPLMNISSLNYYAYDIDTEDIKFLNNYFTLMKKHSKLKGKANILNLKKKHKLPKADISFLFKVLDPLEQGKNHKLSESIITSLKSKYIIASFSTKTITGKTMNHPYRGWIERMLKRINLTFKKITLKNEVFYIIKK